jgi:hypothetical protein
MLLIFGITCGGDSDARGTRIAFGDPARIVSSSDAPSIHKEIAAIGFTKSVFGFEAKSLVDPSAIEELCHRYSRALRRHRDDTAVDS